jgi:AbrB family looped-hinge helix DNA binding protein
MRVTSKGQVTIPVEIREKLGIFPNSEVEFVLRGNSVRLVKVLGKRKGGRGAEVLARLSGSAKSKMTTDQIMALMRGEP